MAFMSPELLVPSKFGIKNSVPTPEADIYAFGVVIFQVRGHDRRCGHFFTPFRSSQEICCLVAFGNRIWDTQLFRGSAQLDQRRPQPSGFPTHCGVSSNAAGMAT